MRPKAAAEAESSASASFLVEGDTCWRRVRADRAAVLIDAAAYFGALRESLLRARRSISILGWELNSYTCLRGDVEPRDRGPLELGRFLRWLLRRNRQLEIRILLWDHSLFYAVNRELFPRWIFGWRKPRRVEIVLDSHLPLGASHHEKLVVIDDAVAYCGGVDLTLRRWDTREHKPIEPRRCDPSNRPYVPVHDVQMVVDGAAAAALAERARERWERAGGKPFAPTAPQGDCWPPGVTPEFEDVPIGVIRTVAALEEKGEEIREVERSTVQALGLAEKLVYVENQYITARVAFDALVARMRSNPRLEALFVTSREAAGWLEAETMGVGRQLFMAAFDEPHLSERVRFLYPFSHGSPGDDEYALPNRAADGTFSIRVHSKVLIIDDRFLRIGSSNLNNRSMGFDTECDLGLEAESAAHRTAIAAVRARLIAEHWGRDVDEVDRVLASGQPVMKALATPSPSRRAVAPVERGETPSGNELVMKLGDPERIVTVEELTGPGPRRKAILLTLGAVALAALTIALLALAKHWPGDNGSSLTENVVASLAALRGSPWRVPLVLVVFVVGSAVAFPILALIGATVVALGPVVGFICATIGTLLAASVTFGIGRLVGRRTLRRWLGRKAQLIERELDGRGVVTIALIRKVPLAPFTVVNMLLGASGVAFREFIVGTALGMVPGIAAFAFVGDRVIEAFLQPTPLNFALILGAITLWIGVVLAVQRLMNRRLRR